MSTRINSISIALLLILQQASLAAHADVYRWVDEEGIVHYSDKPKNLQSAEKIEIKMGSVLKDDNQQERMKKQKRLLSAIKEERNIKKQKQAEKRKVKKKRKLRCQQARNTLNNFDGRRLYNIDKDGNRVYLSDQAREQEAQRARDAITYWCSST